MRIYWQCPDCGGEGEGIPRAWPSRQAMLDHAQTHEDEIDAFLDGKLCLMPGCKINHEERRLLALTLNR
jgi:hypothetical protein